MNTTPSKRETDEILKWLNRNRQMLLDLYKNQYIAYNANGIIAHSENLREVLALANASKQPFLIYLVPRRTASIEILPIRFRSVARHDWQPNYRVILKHRDRNIESNTTMLVNSGAELSLISLIELRYKSDSCKFCKIRCKSILIMARNWVG
ncbi:DUF5678 domain-containing protein [Nostoc sp.]|uniref:DUF5678 domain-containing protein n=1 Tax=Nostoc sp. TaxID=1180 RepID=UPI003FA555FA